MLALAGCGHDGATACAGQALVVADREAGRVYVHDEDRALTAMLNGQDFADHVGFLPLQDGRVLYADEHMPALVELDTGRGVEVCRVALPKAETTCADAPRSVFRPGSASCVLAVLQYDCGRLLDRNRKPRCPRCRFN
jgi:hypothetical protein